jgi:hypothetical protein
MFFALPGLQPTVGTSLKLSRDNRSAFNTVDCSRIVRDLAQVAAGRVPAAEKDAVTGREATGQGNRDPGERPGSGSVIGDRKYNLVQVDTEDIERTLGEVQARRDELVKAKGQYEGDQAKARTTKDRLEKILSSVKGRLPAVPPEEGLVNSLRFNQKRTSARALDAGHRGTPIPTNQKRNWTRFPVV